jgi:hypothetical protein
MRNPHKLEWLEPWRNFGGDRGRWFEPFVGGMRTPGEVSLADARLPAEALRR